MPGESARQVLRQLNTLFRSGVAGPLSDEELLEQFVAGSEESAEAAFTALVDRHGAMVLGVCRRVLGNRHAAEDAFQATFLVLSRKAPEIARRQQLASWLYGVARRAALDARARASRQRASEKRLPIVSAAESTDEMQTTELRSILDEELGRLPERHRAAIVLCELEGLSRRAAASRLGVSEGTLSSRLARAKVRLRDRLARRGLALSATLLEAALTHDSQALTVPTSLVDSTIRIVTMVATSSSLTGVASTSVVTLTEGVLKAMLLSKLKLAFLGVMTVAILTTGAGVVAQDRPSDNDRLRNLERKVDRLLEVLGGSSRRTTTPEPVLDSTPKPTEPAPAAAAKPAAPAAPAAIVAAPPPPAVPATPSIAAPTPTAAPLPVAAHIAPILPPQAARPGMTPPTHPGQSNSINRRVDLLEQRLARLEQRLAEFERRLSGAGAGGVSAPSAGFVTEPPPALRDLAPIATSPGAPPAPPTNRAPVSGSPPAQGTPTPAPSAAPATAPAGAALLSPPAELLDRPSLPASSTAEDSPAEPLPPASPEAPPEN
jgi:RNA polymerase sigma factor (sigma-70 family)